MLEAPAVAVPLNIRRGGVPLAVLLSIALAGMGVVYAARLVTLFPLEHDISAENSMGDDWLVYNQYAVDVLTGGLTIPSISGAYVRPAGFGYVYFIAGVYAIAGIRSEAVYFVQGLLLIGAIAGMYVVFRPHVSRLTGLAFVLTLAVFMYVDAYRALTFRLLSENALFPLFPALLFFVIKGQTTAKHRYLALGGVVCGLCFLARPNLILFGPATAAAVFLFRSSRPFSWRAQAALAVLAGFAAVASLLPLRNYVATGQPTATSVTSRADWSGMRFWRDTEVPLRERLTDRAGRTAARIAYLVGIPQFLRPAFRIRPHWLAMWGAFFWYLYTLVRRRAEFWEVLVLTLAVSYFAPIAEYGAIASYGVRMLAPGVPLILLLAAKGLDRKVPDR